MNKFPPAPMRAPTPETVAYRPFAPLAIVSLAAAGLFALLVIAWGAICFSHGSPLVFPTIVLVLPLAAAVLAVAARRQIHNSEGTRSGMGLATAAFWISLLFGVGYGALYFGTYVAVWWQAERFTDAWVALVRAGKLDEAFLLTRSPLERKDEDPKNTDRMWVRYGRGPSDELSGPWPLFKESEIVRIIRDPAARVQQAGLRRWDFNQQHYMVDQSYRIESPEGTFMVVLAATSRQGSELKGRQWQLHWSNDMNFYSKTLTPLGAKLERWRRDLPAMGAAWLTARRSGNALKMYLETLPPAERPTALVRYKARIADSALAATPMAGETALGILSPCWAGFDGPWIYCDGFGTRNWNLFVRDKDFIALAKPEDRARMMALVRGLLFVRPGPLKMAPKMTPARLLPSDDPQRVRMAQDVEISGWEQEASGAPVERFRIDAALVMETEPGDLDKVDDARWHVVALDLLRGGPPPRKRKAPPQMGPST